MVSRLNYREATAHDAGTLWGLLAIATYEADAAAARGVPVVAVHLEGWSRYGDFGIVAEFAGRAVGAAWARQFDPPEQPSVYVGSRTPEVSIAALSQERGMGVGRTLLDGLKAAARLRELGGLCLNVRDNNPALRQYVHAGYRLIEGSEVPNRVGGHSFGVLLTLSDKAT